MKVGQGKFAPLRTSWSIHISFVGVFSILAQAQYMCTALARAAVRGQGRDVALLWKAGADAEKALAVLVSHDCGEVE